MSDTPRTDALVIEHWGSLKPFAGHPVAEFARQLERENDVLRHKLMKAISEPMDAPGTAGVVGGAGRPWPRSSKYDDPTDDVNW
jgi:hypothetical protein